MKTVFFDVDTQFDFLYPAGALYVPGAEKIVEQVATLNRFAGAQAIPLVSTTDAHFEDDPEFKAWPPHCVVETIGQQKPEATLLAKRIIIPNTRVALNVDAQQFLLEKQTLDCFTNVNVAALLDRFASERYVVYGVVTEICVKFAAFGLLKTGKRVEIVTDAVCGLRDADSSAMTAAFLAAGGVLTTVNVATRVV
ncbi:MAG: cysteine hydrolase [Acidobacteriota bacterium]|nr:cysteine hydrolase [Acidobacteriota bacterium]